MGSWLTRVRRDFPYLDRYTYLNTASAGVSWRGQGAAAAEFYSEAGSLGYGGQPIWRARAASVRGQISRLLNVSDDEVAFFRNTTEVMNLIAHSITWRAGDEVVVAADEFPSVLLPWAAAETAGGRIVRVEPVTEELREQRLLEALGSRTRVLAVSHVHSAAGTRLDLVRLGRACREVDCLLVVDGIQALGACPVDISYVDVYASAVFKWLLSGFGVAVGVIRERTRASLIPAYRGYANPPPSSNLEYAHPNYPGLYVLGSSIDYLEKVGWTRVFQQVELLSEHVADSLARLGITVATPDNARGGIVSFQVKDAEATVTSLARQGVQVEERSGLVRVSPHFYNSTDDIDRLADVLAD